MKLLKLTQKGIAHYVVPLIVIVAVAIGGTAYLVISHAATCTTYDWGYGGSGQCVEDIQTLADFKLQNAPSFYGNLPQLVVDGQFGAKTETAIKAIQKEFTLTQDGIVGPNTWGVLCKEITNNHSGGPFDSAQTAAATNAGCPGY